MLILKFRFPVLEGVEILRLVRECLVAVLLEDRRVALVEGWIKLRQYTLQAARQVAVRDRLLREASDTSNGRCPWQRGCCAELIRLRVLWRAPYDRLVRFFPQLPHRARRKPLDPALDDGPPVRKLQDFDAEPPFVEDEALEDEDEGRGVDLRLTRGPSRRRWPRDAARNLLRQGRVRVLGVAGGALHVVQRGWPERELVPA